MEFYLAVNVSEGKNPEVIGALKESIANKLLDVHCDANHNRSVFSFVDEYPFFLIRSLVKKAFLLLDINGHQGLHPRLGVVDVIPFVPFPIKETYDVSRAVSARNIVGRFLAEKYNVPVFLYGPERTLPEIRKSAFKTLYPDLGPQKPHKQLGAVCMGARNILVAYNLIISGANLSEAKEAVKRYRGQYVQALAFGMDKLVQISFNLINPFIFNPADAYEMVAADFKIEEAELVGLLPEKVLEKIDKKNYEKLALSKEKTIEKRIKNIKNN